MSLASEARQVPMRKCPSRGRPTAPAAPTPRPPSRAARSGILARLVSPGPGPASIAPGAGRGRGGRRRGPAGAPRPGPLPRPAGALGGRRGRRGRGGAPGVVTATAPSLGAGGAGSRGSRAADRQKGCKQFVLPRPIRMPIRILEMRSKNPMALTCWLPLHGNTQAVERRSCLSWTPHCLVP
jgi:hypothetical protein